MKIIRYAMAVVLMSHCLAFTPDDIDELVRQVLGDEVTRAVDMKKDDKKFEERFASLHKRVRQQILTYASDYKIDWQSLPEDLRKEIDCLAVMFTKSILSKASGAYISDYVLKQGLHKLLSKMIDHTARYIEKKDIEKHLDAAIVSVQKRFGVQKQDMSPGLQRTMHTFKQGLHKAMLGRLAHSRLTHTTDRAVNEAVEAASQTLLKHLWIDIQTQGHKRTLAHLAKKHPHSSLYVMPADAKRLQKTANAIRKQIKDW